jgi:hypothetical protein
MTTILTYNRRMIYPYIFYIDCGSFTGQKSIHNDRNADFLAASYFLTSWLLLIDPAPLRLENWGKTFVVP